MNGFLLGFISYFGWSVGDIFGTAASRKIGAYTTTLWVFVIGLVVFSFYIPFALNQLTNPSPEIIFWAFLLGCVYVLSNLLLNTAFASSNASLVGTINATFPAWVVVLSVILLKEPVTLYQSGAILIIFIGVILCTLNPSELRNGSFLKDTGVRLALLTMTGFTVYYTGLKFISPSIGWFWSLYISFLTFPVILIFMKYKHLKINHAVDFRNFLFAGFSALALRIGDFSLNYGLSSGQTSVVAPIAGAYPTLFVILAWIFFRDALTKQQLLGIIITLAGIVFLSFVS